MATTTKLTLEQFLSLEEVKPYLEYEDGEVTPKTMGANWHSLVQYLLSVVFSDYFKSHPVGRVRPELRCLFIQDEHQWAPVADFAFIASVNRRQPRGNRPYRGIPDLVVEILSPDDRASRVNRKLRRYLEVGIELIWLIDPEERTITVMTSLDASRILRDGDTLTGGAVLPHFAVAVSELLPPPDEPAYDDDDDDDLDLTGVPSC